MNLKRILHGLAAASMVAALGAATPANAALTGICDPNVTPGQTTSIYHYGHYDTVRFVRWWDMTGWDDRHMHVWENLHHGNIINQYCGIPGVHPRHM